MTSKPLYTCQNVVEEKPLPPNFLSVWKPLNLSADMALAKEYHGKKRVFSLPLYSHYILFLGHCQPIKQSFHQVDQKKKKKGGGAELGEREETREDRSRKTGTPFYWPNTDRLSKSLYVVVTMTHVETSVPSNEGDNTRKDLGIPHY